MTAEIAVLNKSAVALAADSAVTIGRGASAKIYNSVNKIFELHRSAPVGIMIYGSLSFMGLPLETLIKQYRKDLGDTTFPKISDYKNDFIDWLWKKVPVDIEDEKQIVLFSAIDILEKIDNKIGEEILDEVRKKGKYLKSKDNGIAQKIIKQELSEIRKSNKLPFADKAYQSSIEANFGSAIDVYINHLIRQIQPNQKTKEDIHKALVEFICRSRLTSYRSGFVIAGFGDDERCPSLERFEVEGVIGGKLKYIEGQPVDIGRRGTQADALGFAQSDMIERFLHGVDPDMHAYAEEIIRQSIFQTASEIIAALDPTILIGTIPPALQPVIEKIQNDQINNFRTHKDSEYTRPIFDMIRYMPKQEMAILAKALIDLTSLKRKVSREQESVGGEVDVAVISKSEGFVWVSRKHYFPPELNSRFFSRHYRDVGGGHGSNSP